MAGNRKLRRHFLCRLFDGLVNCYQRHRYGLFQIIDVCDSLFDFLVARMCLDLSSNSRDFVHSKRARRSLERVCRPLQQLNITVSGSPANVTDELWCLIREDLRHLGQYRFRADLSNRQIAIKHAL